MKLWLTEASQFIFNHLQTVLAKTAVNYCHLSFQFGLIPRKKYFVPLVHATSRAIPNPDRCETFPQMQALWGILLPCVVMERKPSQVQVAPPHE